MYGGCKKILGLYRYHLPSWGYPTAQNFNVSTLQLYPSKNVAWDTLQRLSEAQSNRRQSWKRVGKKVTRVALRFLRGCFHVKSVPA